MWQPDFPYVEAIAARLYGWHRAMCIASHHYRGTVQCPGLVLGLDRGGSCHGMAFRVAAAEWPAVKQVLHDREMVTNVYIPKFLQVTLSSGQRVAAYGFVADRQHAQYWRGTPEQAMQLVAQGKGLRGRSRDYLAKTLEQMQDMGIRDRALLRLHNAIVYRYGP